MNTHNDIEKPSCPFTCSIIRSYGAFVRLEEDWKKLVERLDYYQPTSTFNWNHAWYEANKERIDELLIFAFRNKSEELIGIVPLYSYTKEVFKIKVKIIDFFGARDQMMTNLLCIHEHQIFIFNDIVKTLWCHIKNWDIISFSRLNNTYGDTIFLERIFNKNHLRYTVESTVKIPYLKLEGNYSDYFQSLRKNFKRETRRKIKKLESLGEVKFGMKHAKNDAKIIEEYMTLEKSGWKGKNGSSLDQRYYLNKFFYNLLHESSDQVELLNFYMRLDDQLISSSLCVQTRDGLFVLKIAFEEEYHNMSPGLLLRLYEIEYSYEQGLKIYDFSGSYVPWMRFFTSRSHFSMDYILYKPNVAPLLRFLREARIKPPPLKKNYY